MKNILAWLALMGWAMGAHAQVAPNQLPANTAPLNTDVVVTQEQPTARDGDGTVKTTIAQIGTTITGLTPAQLTGVGQLVPCTNGSTGTADAALLAAAATVGGNITITGNCTVNATTTLNSNTTVNLNGYTITAAAAANWSGSTIAAAFNAANNASYIAIQNGYLVWTGASGSVHIISFPSGNSHVRVTNIWSTGAGDLVATVGTTDAISQGNTCLNSLNACFDHWGGATDIKDIGNYASMVTNTGAACYQFTGFNTNSTISTTTGYTAIGNSCYIAVNVQIGINVNGFVGSCTQTSASQAVVADNRIYVATGIEGPAIRLSGCGSYADIHDNLIFADGATTSSYPAIEANSVSWTNVQMHNNLAYGWIGPTTGSDDGIFNNQGPNSSIVNNQCLGTCSSLLIGAVSSTTQIAGNTFGTPDFTVTGANATAPFSVTNTGNLGFNLAASFLAPNAGVGNAASITVGHDTGTGNGVTEFFNYGGNNNGNSYWALEFNGTGVYWLKELYYPDTLYVGDSGSLVNINGGATVNSSAAAGIVGEYWDTNCAVATSGASIAFTNATPTVGTYSSPPWANSKGAPYGSFACPFYISATAPTGLSTNTTYWAVPINATTFHVATSAANAMAGTFAATSGTSSTSTLVSSTYQTGTTTVVAVGAMNLTSGDWDCQMSGIFVPASSTSVTNLQAGINSSGTAIGTLGSYADFETAANVLTATNNPILVSPMFRESLSATTAEYAVTDATFTASTMTESGDFRCRRMR